MLKKREMQELLYLQTVLANPSEKTRWAEREWETLKTRRIALEACYLCALERRLQAMKSATAGPTES